MGHNLLATWRSINFFHWGIGCRNAHDWHEANLSLNTIPEITIRLSRLRGHQRSANVIVAMAKMAIPSMRVVLVDVDRTRF